MSDSLSEEEKRLLLFDETPEYLAMSNAEKKIYFPAVQATILFENCLTMMEFLHQCKWSIVKYLFQSKRFLGVKDLGMT